MCGNIEAAAARKDLFQRAPRSKEYRIHGFGRRHNNAKTLRPDREWQRASKRDDAQITDNPRVSAHTAVDIWWRCWRCIAGAVIWLSSSSQCLVLPGITFKSDSELFDMAQKVMLGKKIMEILMLHFDLRSLSVVINWFQCLRRCIAPLPSRILNTESSPL